MTNTTTSPLAQGELARTLGQILIPMVTPFDENGDVNLKYAAELTDTLIERRACDSLIVAGTTGEFHTLSNDERVQLFRTVKDAAADRVPLIAGTGSASTRDAVELSRTAEEIGYDVLMVVAPYYAKPTQEGIYLYYEKVAASVSVPVMLYNIPIFTGVNVDPPTVTRLSRIANILGIKDEAGINPTQMIEYANAAEGDFTVYNGDDIMILCGMIQGAAGVVSGASHILSGPIREMMGAFVDGDLVRAHEIHRKLDPFLKSLAPGDRVNPIPGLRAAMEEAGMPVGPARPPLDEITDEERAALRNGLRELGVVS